MARLESISTAGYFPTPPRVAARIARFLEPEPPQGKRVIRLLDPCAGEGTAAKMVAAAVEAETYGIEVQDDRAKAAEAALDHVLHCDNEFVKLSNGAWSILFCNPPYDYHDEKKRMEHWTLTGMTRALCPGGVLVFLLPVGRLHVSARYLAAHYENLDLYRFPDPEYAAFRQIIVFGTRKQVARADRHVQMKLEAVSVQGGSVLPELPDEPADTFRVPRRPVAADVLFAPLAFDGVRARAEADKRGIFTDPFWREQVWPPDYTGVRPLQGLRGGHRALLVAAGMLNNELLEGPGGSAVLVKGRANKVLVRVHHKTTDADGNEVEVDDDKTVVEREVLKSSMWMLYLESGIFETIEQGGPGATSTVS